MKDIQRILYLFLMFIGILSLLVLALYLNSSKENYIQASHQDTDYKLDKATRTITIKDVDKVYKATGMSMQPTMFSGNIMLAQLYTNQTLKEGMIIVTTNYTHRIRGIYPDYVLTQGDNNGAYDNKVKYSDIKAIVLGVIYK